MKKTNTGILDNTAEIDTMVDDLKNELDINE